MVWSLFPSFYRGLKTTAQAPVPVPAVARPGVARFE